MKELTTQGDYQLRMRDLQTDEKIKALTDAAATQAAAAKARYEALDQAREGLKCRTVMLMPVFLTHTDTAYPSLLECFLAL